MSTPAQESTAALVAAKLGAPVWLYVLYCNERGREHFTGCGVVELPTPEEVLACVQQDLDPGTYNLFVGRLQPTFGEWGTTTGQLYSFKVGA